MNNSELKNIIKENKYTTICFCLLFAFALLLRLSIKEISFSSIFFSLLNTAFIYIVIACFSKTIIRIPLSIIIALLIAIDITVLYTCGEALNYGILASILETNTEEAYSMSGLYLPMGAITFILLSFILIKTSNELKKSSKINIYFTALFLILSIFCIPLFLEIKSGGDNINVAKEKAKSSISYFFARIIPIKYPLIVSDFFLYAAYKTDMKTITSSVNIPKQLPQGISVKTESNVPEKIIFIIGESSYNAHYSLYGYNLNTTPFLDSLNNNSNLLNFYNNAISSANYTRDALRISLSFASPQNGQAFLDKKNIVHLAEDAGYETYWISNQSKYGPVDSFVGIISATAQNSYYEKKLRRDDLELIPVLKQALENDKKQFITLHLSGSHMMYDERYDETDTKALGSDGKTIEYDKSVHHTDRVLREAFSTINKAHQKALIYYFSDHGEQVNVGHSIPNKWKSQYQVPLIIIQNKPFLDTNSIICKYYDSRSRINTNATPYILGEIMGYSITDSLIEKTKRDGLYIYQADGSVIPFDNIID
ncbi:phosphoethanolamine transferase [Dysgonomonas sp. 216]|uniref:phosphoethanolamine transferase n=1 Tax=Dysgonomonas sp. 216 TaxID=2302934 RepID=UPI0013D377F4|nr:phosphoethanolamine transferase [Dysgonomonas sp. 216]